MTCPNGLSMLFFSRAQFSSSCNNHVTWPCPISLCTCTPSSKFPDGSVPQVRRSQQHNLMDRKLGMKIKSVFPTTYCKPSFSYESIRSCTSILKFAGLQFPKKQFENFSKDYHVALSQSLKTASNCLSLKSCLIRGPINTLAFIFS